MKSLLADIRKELTGLGGKSSATGEPVTISSKTTEPGTATTGNVREVGLTEPSFAGEPKVEPEPENHPLRTDSAPVAWVDRRLTDLFDRVNQLLGAPQEDTGGYRPKCPTTIEEAGLTREEVEGLILKYLAARGTASGRQICNQIKLPFCIIEPIVRDLKFDHLLSLSGTAEASDFNYSITDTGRSRARAFSLECSYFGAAPVPLKDYLEAMAAQSIAKQTVNVEELHDAFKDLIINKKMLDTLGPAINSGRGMFLYGEPGNGKTSIA
jgi:hypothetical protein